MQREAQLQEELQEQRDVDRQLLDTLLPEMRRSDEQRSQLFRQLRRRHAVQLQQRDEQLAAAQGEAACRHVACRGALGRKLICVMSRCAVLPLGHLK
jgi:hypothetical protein